METLALIKRSAEYLRDLIRPSDYQEVIMPFLILRRLDCVLEATKTAVLAEALRWQGAHDSEMQTSLCRVAQQSFYNLHPHSLSQLNASSSTLASDIVAYAEAFSPNVLDIIQRFNFADITKRIGRHGVLPLFFGEFCRMDLSPAMVDNNQMGELLETVLYWFNELEGDTGGDHFTPREIVRLMVDLLLAYPLAKGQRPLRVYDATCGTGGMLMEAHRHLQAQGLTAFLAGQDYNATSYSIAAADLLMYGLNGRIVYGDTLTQDGFAGERFDYFLANPPFGVDWKKQRDHVVREHEQKRGNGRFGAGLPRVTDGSLLFLQHMMSKFEPYNPEQGQHGSRLAIVFNGSPMFTGDAGSGESDIRKWLIESDFLEAIIALPEGIFCNTGIATYIWIISNHKTAVRRGKVQLVDGRLRFAHMRRNVGQKRHILLAEHLEAILADYIGFEESDTSKIYEGSFFGFRKMTVERPLRLTFQMTEAKVNEFLTANQTLEADTRLILAKMGNEPYNDWNVAQSEIAKALASGRRKWAKSDWGLFRRAFTETNEEAESVIKADGCMDIPEWGCFGGLRYEADPDLRDTETVPLGTEPIEFLRREVLPHVPCAWMEGEGTVGYEINFNRYFYKYVPLRYVAEIQADIMKLNDEIAGLMDLILGHTPTKIKDEVTDVQSPMDWREMSYIERFS